MPWGFWPTLLVCIFVAAVLYGIYQRGGWLKSKVNALGSLSLPSLGALGARLAAIGGTGWLRLAAIPLVVAAIWGVVAYIEGRGADKQRIKDLRADVEVAEHEARLERKAGELGINTTRDRARVAAVVTQAEREIADAVEADDFDRLYLAYRRAYDGVWLDLPSADSADPGAGGIAPVRGPRSDSA